MDAMDTVDAVDTVEAVDAMDAGRWIRWMRSVDPGGRGRSPGTQRHQAAAGGSAHGDVPERSWGSARSCSQRSSRVSAACGAKQSHVWDEKKAELLNALLAWVSIEQLLSCYSAPEMEDKDGEQNEALIIQEETDLLHYLTKKANGILACTSDSAANRARAVVVPCTWHW